VELRVGDLTILPLSDGEFRTGPEYFGPSATFADHQDLLGADGKLHLPIGCFLFRGGPLWAQTLLVDAGLGRMSAEDVDGGALMGQLSGVAVSPEDIDVLVCTHLHIDHCGWVIAEDGRPGFPNATLWVGRGDWERFVENVEDLMLEHTRVGLRALAEAGRVQLVDEDTTVAPGVSALLAPGHTPGHLVVVASHGDQRAVLLGDAISCPVQLDETDWAAISDVDPELARRTRDRLWRELETSGDPAVGAHFPELRFGRLLTGHGRRWV
jgi:glyoxylase-like metal-dependent hydrolase (beta-lactamase superfamily II)